MAHLDNSYTELSNLIGQFEGYYQCPSSMAAGTHRQKCCISRCALIGIS
jgi:hypothetical protein